MATFASLHGCLPGLPVPRRLPGAQASGGRVLLPRRAHHPPTCHPEPLVRLATRHRSLQRGPGTLRRLASAQERRASPPITHRCVIPSGATPPGRWPSPCSGVEGPGGTHGAVCSRRHPVSVRPRYAGSRSAARGRNATVLLRGPGGQASRMPPDPTHSTSPHRSCHHPACAVPLGMTRQSACHARDGNPPPCCYHPCIAKFIVRGVSVEPQPLRGGNPRTPGSPRSRHHALVGEMICRA